ncbi:MAG TPA: SusD/RagB family nutrient-binding outer membrane lipoprotein [Longimicrobiales bacterium]
MWNHRASAGIGLALVLALAAGGCENFLDVNDDPNAPESVPVAQILPGIIVEFTELGTGSPLYSPEGWTSLWMQQWSYNQPWPYSRTDLYEVTAIDTDDVWAEAYDDVMIEAKNLMDVAEANEDWAYHGLAQFLLAWTATRLSDMFGPIPFTEALDPLNPDPAYDDQQVVYQTAQQMIAEAIEEMQMPGDNVPGENDLIFGGDMARWVQLAHTVQARLHMRLAYAPGESPTDRAQKALDELANGITESVAFDYIGGEGNRQPLYDYDGADWNTRYVIAAPFIDLLEGLNDPRLPIMVAPAAYDGAFRGHIPAADRMVTGDPFFDDSDRCTVAPASCDPDDEDYPDIAWNDSIFSHIGAAITVDSTDYVWVGMPEVHFLEAEAQLILGGAAQPAYEAGIRAHMESLGVDPAAIQAYLDQLPPLASLGNEGALEAIMTQKYIANFLHGIEVWNDWRRTGYPTIIPVDSAYVDGIPQRLRTPSAEIAYNGDNVAATGIPTGLEGMLQKVWWASGN